MQGYNKAKDAVPMRLPWSSSPLRLMWDRRPRRSPQSASVREASLFGRFAFCFSLECHSSDCTNRLSVNHVPGSDLSVVTISTRMSAVALYFMSLQEAFVALWWRASHRAAHGSPRHILILHSKRRTAASAADGGPRFPGRIAHHRAQRDGFHIPSPSANLAGDQGK
jgi:hypothetical protein